MFGVYLESLEFIVVIMVVIIIVLLKICVFKSHFFLFKIFLGKRLKLDVGLMSATF